MDLSLLARAPQSAEENSSVESGGAVPDSVSRSGNPLPIDLSKTSTIQRRSTPRSTENPSKRLKSDLIIDNFESRRTLLFVSGTIGSSLPLLIKHSQCDNLARFYIGGSDSSADICRQEVAEEALRRINVGEFHIISCEMPIATFTSQLRGEGKSIYGICRRPEEKERVRRETLGILRIVALIRSALQVRKVAMLTAEEVVHQSSKLSPWDLPEVKALLEYKSEDTSQWLYHNLSWAPGVQEDKFSVGRSRVRLVFFKASFPSSSSSDSLPQHFQGRPRLSLNHPLTGSQEELKKIREEEEAIGGLRRTARATARIPGHLV